MQTQLNYKAYLSGALFIFIPLVAWGIVFQTDVTLNQKMTSLLTFVHITCWGIFLYTLFTEYWQYTCDDQNLIIVNIITQSQKIVPLKNILKIELQQHQLKNGHYHSIKLTLENEIVILRGLYADKIEDFSAFLKSKINS